MSLKSAAVWKMAHPEEARARNRARYAANPERFRAEARARRADPEYARRSNERAARWRTEHPERTREFYREWRVNNPSGARAKEQTRRARELGAMVERVDPAVVWESCGGICHICNRPADMQNWHLEHVIPLSRGGEHSYANTRVAHPLCNLRKGITCGR